MNAVGKLGCLVIGLIGMIVAGCDETFELNAPYQDIYAVYAVLNPSVDTQYVRVSLGFQPEENAIEFAKSYDGSVPGLSVSIIGEGIRLEGEYVDQIAKNDPGDFAETAGAYRFLSSGTNRLQSGGVYRLEIRKDDDPDFFIESHTRIPNEPRVLSPSRFASSSSGEVCLPTVNVEDTVSVLIKLNETEENPSAYYQVRWVLRYEENGQRWELSTPPSTIFNVNVRCALAGNGNLCYSTGNGTVLSLWKQTIPTEAVSFPITTRCSRIPIELTSNAELQVTALDSALSTYIIVNDPKELNFNTIRREYTNLKGSSIVVGVFGSIAYDNEPFLISSCAEHELGLKNDPFACQ